MDIRTTGGRATGEEMAAVDGLLGEPESLWQGGERHPADDHVAYGGRAVRSQRHLLLPVLHAIQDRVGWVSRGALEYACRRLSIPPAEAYGVVSFYARFALEPRGDVTLHVCDDISCMLAGAKVPEGARRVPCLGLCDRAPAALVERPGIDHEEIQVAPFAAGAPLPATAFTPALSPAGRGRLLRRLGVVDPQSVDSYIANGGVAG